MTDNSRRTTEIDTDGHTLALQGARPISINIDAGSGENADLSNFAEYDFQILDFKTNKSFTYPSVEHYFQISKLMILEDKPNISMGEIIDLQQKRQNMLAMTPSQVKAAGRNIQLTQAQVKKWDSISEQVMKEGITESMKQNPDRLKLLLKTGNALLTHNQDNGKWKTLFPKILMEVREELKTLQEYSSKIFNDSENNVFDSMFETNVSSQIEPSNDPPFSQESEKLNKSRDRRVEINSAVDKLRQIYGVNARVMSNMEMQSFGNEIGMNLSTARGLVYNGEIIINSDKASTAEAFHEMGHLIVPGLQALNPKLWEVIKEKVTNHPTYLQVKEVYPNLSANDLVEEAFVTIFGEYYRKLQLNPSEIKWNDENGQNIETLAEGAPQLLADIFSIDEIGNISTDELMNL